MHEKHAVQRGFLGTSSAFVIEPRKTTENLDPVVRWQNLPKAYWLPGSSPALKYTNSSSCPNMCDSFVDKKVTDVLQKFTFFLWMSNKQFDYLCTQTYLHKHLLHTITLFSFLFPLVNTNSDKKILKKFPDLKVSRQCPIVLLVKVGR